MPKIRLAAIGDSLTQGFQSAAIHHTAWSFPAILARSFGCSVPGDFRVPSFGTYGLPLNLEQLMDRAAATLSKQPSELEVALRLPILIPQFLDEVETYHERGPGSGKAKFGGSYHNLAVWGFAVAEAARLSVERCTRAIEKDEGWIEDDFLGLPSGAMYRTARKVFNPQLVAARNLDTQLTALERLLESEGELDVLTFWLGANDALGTVLNVEIKDMEGVKNLPQDPVELLDWNLTSAERFDVEYTALAARLDDILARRSPRTRVFVGTVPHVTIPPITRGQGAFDGTYFDYYTRFFVPPGSLTFGLEKLTRADARSIDTRIDRFNAVIRREVAGREPSWQLVDTCAVLDELAVRRNGFDAEPGLALRRYYERRGRPDHPLLQLDPIPSILMYGVDQSGKRVQGGLISLDGVHPSTLGYGLVAEHFLEAMQRAAVPGADPRHVPWPAVIENDGLVTRPPRVWWHLMRAGERYSWLWGALARALA
jgi:lysophospholipase L1-like esterase